jgi:putative FmdB family regulatory protein
MPIFEYRCKHCGQTKEVLTQNFSDAQPPYCPGCGEKMEKRFSSPVIVMGKSDYPGRTCCGREERCDKPPCTGGGGCHRH